MLLAWFRGAFLVGILAWYSISVWKLIDGYFKDQFENYLKEEYRKNPRMKTDVERGARNSVNKKESLLTEIPTTPSTDDSPLEAMVRQVEEKRSIDVVGSNNTKIEGKHREENRRVHWRNDERNEEENDEATSDELSSENAFLQCTKCRSKSDAFGSDDGEAQDEEEAQRNCEAAEEKSKRKEEPKMKWAVGTITLSREGKMKSRKASFLTTTTTTTTETGESTMKKKRTKVITLKESDFADARGGVGGNIRSRRIKVETDKDFWEFEEDEEEPEKREGISVEELPFKPRVDIGRLERVTADEYCPLTLEDELSCGETSKWP